jgi:hypothetical protein
MEIALERVLQPHSLVFTGQKATMLISNILPRHQPPHQLE